MNHKKEIQIINNFDVQVCAPKYFIEKYILLYDNKTEDDGGLLAFLDKGDQLKNCQLIIMTVIEGNISLSVNEEKDITLEKSDYIYITADSIFSVKSRSTDFKYQLVILYPQLLREIFRDQGRSYNITEFSYNHKVRKCDEAFFKYKQEIYNELKEGLQHERERQKRNIARSYGSIIEINNIERFKTDPQARKAISRQENVYHNFMDLLNSYSDKEREVQFYADKLGITPKYLSAVALEYSNKNASTWIDEYVTTKAKSLLRENQYAIKQVSELLNFPSQSFFGRYFKRIVGVSPRKFVESCKNQ